MADTLTRTAAGRQLFSRPAAVASCIGFVLIGMLQALYGPAVPGLRAQYGLSPSAAGLGLSLHFTGGVAGVLAFNAIHSRISNRALLSASYALMATGGAGFALAAGWTGTRPGSRTSSSVCWAGCSWRQPCSRRWPAPIRPRPYGACAPG